LEGDSSTEEVKPTRTRGRRGRAGSGHDQGTHSDDDDEYIEEIPRPIEKVSG
jgi:hypothetical protein